MKFNTRKPYIFLLVAASALVSALSIIKYGVLTTADTESYINAFDVYMSGGIDKFRTPIYPIFLGIMKGIFGSHFPLATIIVQHIIFIATLPFFFSLTEKLFKSLPFSMILSVLLLLAIEIANWNNFLMTESLSTSLTILLLFSLYNLVKKPSVPTFLTCLLLSVLILLIRPAFIYLIPAFCIFFVILLFSKKHRKASAYYCMAITAALTIVASAYVIVFHNVFGVYAFSNVSIVNKYYTLRQNGLIDTSESSNSALVADIENFKKINGETNRFIRRTYHEIQTLDSIYPLYDIDKIVTSSISHNKGKCASLVLGRFRMAMTDYDTVPVSFYSLVKNKITYIYLVLLFATIIIAWGFIRRREPNQWLLMLYVLAMGHFATTFIGAQGDWHRLLEPAMPIFLLLAGEIFIRHIKPRLPRVPSRNKQAGASTR
ncbi:MAG: glycosyltransferase family 39 protein [Muribaculaceae bacterium]|nr:glycosyltransferase family 39 protein [Muribaculaceae bacterium]